MKYTNEHLTKLGELTSFTFKNQIQKDLWDEELTGQISDGMWENNSKNSWQFWTSVNSTVNTEKATHIESKMSYLPDIKYAFQFTALIEYVGDRMIEIGKKYNPNYNEKLLRKDLAEIKKAMKEITLISE